MTVVAREHLELAALAAGMTYRGDQWSSLAMTGDGVWQSWRPHTDIADAARLAVRLGIIVQPMKRHDLCHAWPTGDRYPDCRRFASHNGSEDDAERAYCEAVTLCAAEIGLRMREGGR